MIKRESIYQEKIYKIEQFYLGDGKILEDFEIKFIEEEKYSEDRDNYVRVCHDAFIFYEGKVLLFKRNNEPEKGEFWPIGGAVHKGRSFEKSLRIKVENECGLKIKNLQLIGINRLLIGPTENFKKGSDDITFSYFVEGEGKIIMDKDNKDYLLVGLVDFENIKNSLNEYVSKMVEKCFEVQKNLQS